MWDRTATCTSRAGSVTRSPCTTRGPVRSSTASGPNVGFTAPTISLSRPTDILFVMCTNGMFVVPRTTPGVEIQPEPRNHNHIIYNDVRVPLDHLLGPARAESSPECCSIHHGPTCIVPGTNAAYITARTACSRPAAT